MGLTAEGRMVNKNVEGIKLCCELRITYAGYNGVAFRTKQIGLIHE